MITSDIDSAFQTEEDDNVQPILLAASEHDVPALRRLLRGSSSSPANVKDSDTGYTPLHSAISACAPDPDEHVNGSDGLATVNGNGIESETRLPDEEGETDQALDTIRCLLQNGAIWNELDNQNETPGCLALRLGLRKAYELMVDAGVRAEMLLNRLDEYEPLNDHASDDEEPSESMTEAAESSEAAGISQAGEDNTGQATAIAAEGQATGDYLDATLTFAPDRLVDSEGNGVMMAWEEDIMAQSVDALIPTEGLRILNIGHGMGIIDEIFQKRKPKAHHIVEAHSEVLANMRRTGWYEKEGVVVHEGRWQEIMSELIADGQTFDAIYFDTFGEDYKALRQFFDEFVIGLLQDGGRFSFFNGLGADRQICYDVYAKVVEMDLLECGFDVDWSTVQVENPLSEETWTGLKRPYWTLAEYRLPLVTFLG